MKFDLQLDPSMQLDDHRINQLTLKMQLFISREEMIKAFEEDETNYYLTLRQIVYMYHSSYGYDTQLTDESMLQLYYAVKNNEHSEGATFFLEETEDIYPDISYQKSHSVKLNLTF